jgi:hypothetical protein
LAFLEELSLQVTAKRRRVEVASVAIRAIWENAQTAHHATDPAIESPSGEEPVGGCVEEEPRGRAAAEHAASRAPWVILPAPHDSTAPHVDRDDRPSGEPSAALPPVEADAGDGADSWWAGATAPSDSPTSDFEPAKLGRTEPEYVLERPLWRRNAWEAPAEADEPAAAESALADFEPDRASTPSEAPRPPEAADAHWREDYPWTGLEPATRPSAAAAAAATMEFESLRAAAYSAAATPRFALRDGVRGAGAILGVPVLVVVFGTAVWLAAGALWPAPAARVPEAPPGAGHAPLSARPLPEDWASWSPPGLGEVIAPSARRPVIAVPAPPPAGSSAPPFGDAPIPAPLASTADPPIQSAAAGPVAPPGTAASFGPSGAPSPSRGTAASTPSEVARPADSDALFSWMTPGVEPPVLRYASVASTAQQSPEAVIDGPYFEVLVDAEGNVETVRIRGRIERGETFYRHRMMLAAAKLWRFTPARFKGRPVRYVTRVVLQDP